MHNLELAHGLHCCAESPASVTHELCSTMVFTFFFKFIFKNYFLTLWFLCCCVKSLPSDVWPARATFCGIVQASRSRSLSCRGAQALRVHVQ